MFTRDLFSNSLSGLIFAGALFAFGSSASAAAHLGPHHDMEAPSGVALAGPRPPAGQKWDPCEQVGACLIDPAQSVALAGPRPPAGQKWDPCEQVGACLIDPAQSVALAGPRPPAGQKWDPCEQVGACLVRNS